MRSDLRLRVAVVAILLLAGRYAAASRAPAPLPLDAPLTAFPRAVGAWTMVEDRPLDAETARVLGADDHLNRIYASPSLGPVAFYVGYYGAQTQGDSIHSPRNCLPGNGWLPVTSSQPLLPAGDRAVPVNRYVIERRGERQLVLYWFQGRRRVVAGEYANKAYLLHDALRFGRTDGALVRVIAPLRGAERDADAAATQFAGAVLPRLWEWLP